MTTSDRRSDEVAELNAELDASLSATACTIRFGEVLAARGEATAALNEHGRLTRYYPDGTTSPLGQKSGAVVVPTRHHPLVSRLPEP
ncbi:hypothetical protein [Modestobacter sp. VKM Ac-2984]|uniref:hypothetical protein n=1 Tax=Modestobacter sp. VKM Ac-2984 TaxID=3004138 RepID=UPI0022AA583B|nr:hypothetical protein [Modestobacter sp. VKM Ac-2984]MCZ2818010.1 hypothetical protein [Modestobacter sp. VKM Ac-2984]